MRLLIVFFLCIHSLFSFSQTSVVNAAIAEREKKGSINQFLDDVGNYTLASPNFTTTYARCSWNINPAVYAISGSVMYNILLTKDANTIVFDFDTSLTVDRVIMHNAQVSFLQSNDRTLSISFPQTIAAGSHDSLSIFYHGIPNSNTDGSFTQSFHNNIPVIWTLSEPYGARNWWPCRNGLDDKIDSLDIFITHPAIYSASANGLLWDTLLQNDNITTHFRHRYPIATYLVGIAVSNYQTFTKLLPLQQGSLPVTTTVFPESFNYYQSNIQPVYNALQLYDKYFGAYPFAKERYGQTQFLWNGGMEHQTNSFIKSPDQYLMAHELAHQWFGDKVTTGSWQDIWLNEGFATYLGNFFYSEYYQPENLGIIASQSIDYATANPHGSVWVDDTTSMNRIFDFNLTYEKGAMLLRMLRRTLGDSSFFKGIRQYIDDPLLRYRFARTADLQRNLENVSGKNLAAFFNQWFYGKGYPSFNVQWNWQDNNIYLQIDETTSDASVSCFTTPLQLRFVSANNQKDVVISIDKSRSKLALPLAFKPDSILIDPEQYLVSKNNVSKQGNLSDLFIEYPLVVYPNPASGVVNIRLEGVDTVHTQTVRIISSSGAILFAHSFTNISNNTIQIPVAQLSSGVYFILLRDEKGNLVKRKFIKQ